jgi:hypothetical protein
LDTLRDAGIDTRGARGPDLYVAQRAQWQGYVRELATYMQFDLSEVDPIAETGAPRRPELRPAHEARR